MTHARRGDSPDRASVLGSLWRRPVEQRRQEALLRRLRCLALAQIGHSRRIAAAPVRVGPTLVFPYVCETGFEHRRQSHRWLVAACDLDHDCSRAAITAQDWLIAAAWSPACREVFLTEPASAKLTSLTEPASVKPVSPYRLTLIVEDDEEWRPRLRGRLIEWLIAQPADRSWEIAPGLIAAYEAFRPVDTAPGELAESVEQLARLLAPA